MADGTPRDATSVEELDARIEEQLAILGGIDAQMVDRASAVQSGDLERADFIAWAVRAQERRQHAASDLASLRHRRHEAVRDESCARIEVVRLRNALAAEQARANGTEKQRRAIEGLQAELASARRTIEHMRQSFGTTDLRTHSLGEEIARLNAAHGEKLKRAREGHWRALLDGEVAILHPELSQRYLNSARAAVPAGFRDACAARDEAEGMPRPRTSAECAAEVSRG